jgi:hypothetical protein
MPHGLTPPENPSHPPPPPPYFYSLYRGFNAPTINENTAGRHFRRLCDNTLKTRSESRIWAYRLFLLLATRANTLAVSPPSLRHYNSQYRNTARNVGQCRRGELCSPASVSNTMESLFHVHISHSLKKEAV